MKDNVRNTPRIYRGAAICGGTVLGLYAVACGAIGLFQERILYPGAGRKKQTAGEGWTRYTSLIADAGEIEGFYWEAKPGMPTIMYLHGNGSGHSDVMLATRQYIEAGYGVLAPEYPGFWGNPGRPREHLLAAAAKAGMTWLEAKGIARSEVIVIGNSIGTGPATQTAVDGARALIIISGVAHMKELARLHFGYLPSLFLRDAYHNEATATLIAMPVLVIHGTLDRLVPVAQGRRLAAATKAQYEEITGGDHYLTYRDDIQKKVLGWMNNLIAPEATLQQAA